MLECYRDKATPSPIQGFALLGVFVAREPAACDSHTSQSVAIEDLVKNRNRKL